MNLRQLGAAGARVSALGLGCMGMSDFYGAADRGESLATIRAALDAGVTLLDTGDYYGTGHNELLIGRASIPSQLAVAWVLAKGASIVPLIGARTRAQLEESLGALRIVLSPAEVVRIEEAVPASAVAGTRYDEQQMRLLDSER